MKAVVRDAARAWAFTVEEVDVDGDPALAARYGQDVPVLALDGHEVARHRLTPDALEALLAAAGDRAPARLTRGPPFRPTWR